MSDEPRHKRTGETLSEVIAQYPMELDRDAVGMFQIVPGGRHGFGLAGDQLASYVERAIRALLDAGAVPVRGSTDGEHLWVAQRQYGSKPEDIVLSVLAEWKLMDDDPLVLASQGVWFARPKASAGYVKLS